MQISKWWRKGRYLIVFCVVSMLLSFLIEPADGASERMWKGYYAQNEIDTIFVGSSVAQQTFIPGIFETQLGVKAYNMGTPSQAMPQTIQAVKTAVEEHEIKTIIFGMGFASLKYGPIEEAALTFESARTREMGGLKGIVEKIAYIYSEDVWAEEKSINYLFPWLYNYEEPIGKSMKKNVLAKTTKIKNEILSKNANSAEIEEKGYRNGDTRVYEKATMWESNTDCFYEAEFDEKMWCEFKNLLQFCKEQRIDLIVVNTPHPAFDVVACHEYYEINHNQVKTLCNTYGMDYYDFSLAKPEKYGMDEDYFADYEHLNQQGSKEFCVKLCDFLKRRANGENMEQYFVSVDEFLQAHEELLQVYLND